LARFLASEEGNVKRLQGVEPPLYRLRTQDHRVIFRDLGDDLIEVTRVRNRKDAYR
jgi:mRNA-degrading endonuclease RelE of RelBE toxin-antitoxin system